MPKHQETILIVDDEEDIRELLIQKLSREGYTCCEAGNADETMEKLTETKPELVTLDIRLPGKSGVVLLPEIKNVCPNTAIIVATAVAETSVAIDCIRRGANDYICKPFRLEEVVSCVERNLANRRLQLEVNEYQHQLETKVGEQTQEIRKLYLGAIEALVFALEAKDKYTAGHSRRVTRIALAIGKKLGLTETELEDLRWGSLLHDVGKIAVDQLVQNKTGKLSQAEYEHIMIHPHVGAGIVKPIVNQNVIEIIQHHHDHFNGKGLHQVVSGQAIPLGARIVAVADAFDAMTSARPYRATATLEQARTEIVRCSETQFDPAIVRIFLECQEWDEPKTR